MSGRKTRGGQVRVSKPRALFESRATAEDDVSGIQGTLSGAWSANTTKKREQATGEQAVAISIEATADASELQVLVAERCDTLRTDYMERYRKGNTIDWCMYGTLPSVPECAFSNARYGGLPTNGIDRFRSNGRCPLADSSKASTVGHVTGAGKMLCSQTLECAWHPARSHSRQTRGLMGDRCAGDQFVAGIEELEGLTPLARFPGCAAALGQCALQTFAGRSRFTRSKRFCYQMRRIWRQADVHARIARLGKQALQGPAGPWFTLIAPARMMLRMIGGHR